MPLQNHSFADGLDYWYLQTHDIIRSTQNFENLCWWKNADLSHYPKIAEKKKKSPILPLFLGLFYSLEVVDLVTFQHNLL